MKEEEYWIVDNLVGNKYLITKMHDKEFI